MVRGSRLAACEPSYLSTASFTTHSRGTKQATMTMLSRPFIKRSFALKS